MTDDMAVLALTPEQQERRVAQARARVLDFPADIVSRQLRAVEPHRLAGFACGEVIVESNGIGVVSHQRGSEIHIALVIVDVGQGGRSGCLGTHAVAELRVDADGVDAAVTLLTAVAEQLIRLRAGGWQLRGFGCLPHVYLHSPLTDDEQGRGSAGRLRKRYRGVGHLSRLRRRLRTLRGIGDMPTFSPKGAEQARKAARQVVEVARLAEERTARDRKATEALAAATGRAQSLRERVITSQVLDATPELDTTSTLDVIERVQLRLDRDPSTNLRDAIHVETQAVDPWS